MEMHEDWHYCPNAERKLKPYPQVYCSYLHDFSYYTKFNGVSVANEMFNLLQEISKIQDSYDLQDLKRRIMDTLSKITEKRF